MEWTGLGHRPLHAAALGEMIAISAQIEHCLGYMLATFNGGNAAISIEMFSAVTSTDAQRAMLQVAGERALKDDPEALAHFNDLMNEWKPRYAERSKLVHNMWGWSKDHPDKALWCHASQGNVLWIAVADIDSAEAALQVARVAGGIWQYTFTYTVKDIQDVTARLDEYANRVLKFLHEMLTKRLRTIAQANGLPDGALGLA